MFLAEPPCDDYEMIEDIVTQACKEFLVRSYKTKRFDALYDLMFEEIRENLYKYLPQD